MASAKKTAGTKSVGGGPSAKKTDGTGAAKSAKGKGPAKETGTPRDVAKKSAAKKAPAKAHTAKGSSSRKYGPLASQEVAAEMHEMKLGKLTIGKSGEKVTNPKQAIAIGLAKARREGGKVPPNPNTGR